MSTKPPAQSDPAIDLDFTGVFRIEELRLEPAPPVPKRPPEDIVIGARAIKKGNSFINMARSRPARRIDPAQTTILLVEDDTTTRLIIDVICRKAGYLTRQAADAPSFIAAMQKKPLPDVVILDVALPGNVSGFKILGKIRAHPVLNTMPVIILTVHSEPADLMQAVSLGTDAYLTKPASARSLLDALAAVLGSSAAAKP
ncbi:MAG: response regulator [Betaproteobacteria bacterium]|nr:response regulator [Betaproteobacteria bacterium]